MMSNDVLEQLSATIKARRRAKADQSYTRQLLDAGPSRCAKKLGEEAIETVIAGCSEDNRALTSEAADLLYHLLVLLESRNVAWNDVTDELSKRMDTSGLVEKQRRSEATG